MLIYSIYKSLFMFCLKQKDEHKKRAILFLCVFPLHILHLDKIVWIFTLQAHLNIAYILFQTVQVCMLKCNHINYGNFLSL